MSPHPTPTAIPTPSRLYHGVSLEPDGRWAAHVTEGGPRLIGHFRSETGAALAHDRVAVFLGAPLVHGRVNFPPSFSAMERLFLRRCTEEFVRRAVLVRRHVRHGARGLPLRRVREVPVRRRRRGDGPRRRGVRGAGGPPVAARTFVMAHWNPVICSSWVARFHDGDPNRSFFTCEEAHEWEAARRRAAPREAVAARKDATPPPPPPDRAERGEEERRAPESSPPVKPGSVSPPSQWHSLKRWLRRTCCFHEQTELQVPLLQLV
ncbi:hypothetical protein ACP70R_038057 [Stipagrostis hirtigluma subsp. patula]